MFVAAISIQYTIITQHARARGQAIDCVSVIIVDTKIVKSGDVGT